VATTNGGQYSVEVTSFGAASLAIDASYAGDAMHWPAYVRIQR
jgi:hypothetical protein